MDARSILDWQSIDIPIGTPSRVPSYLVPMMQYIYTLIYRVFCKMDFSLLSFADDTKHQQKYQDSRHILEGFFISFGSIWLNVTGFLFKLI